MDFLPPPDSSTAYVDDKNRPSKDFYNWIKSLYDLLRSAISEIETLADQYSEAQWVPDLRFGGGNTGLTYTVQVGKYVKIGHIIHVDANIIVNAVGASAGDATIEGLPFACTADSSGVLVAGFSGIVPGAATIGSFFALVQDGSTTIDLAFMDTTAGGGTPVPLTNSNITVGSVIFVSGTYLTD